ncbi:MAG: hypothetical protein K0Q58_1374 [Microbacterium sp.]|nr:hypothetical protein [Microbacterium sp.]
MTASSTSPDVPDLERIVAATVGAVAGGDEGSLQALRDAFAGSARARVLPTVESARQEVEGLRRRAGELSVLYSSARELAGVRDADAVLVRLVERAHAMLGADITYLSEFDPASRELRVRTTYGSVSAAFRELVVPPGRGLVSAIAETRMPQAVSRYRDYAAERHDAVIDDAVAAEGIVSLVGVPLRTEIGGGDARDPRRAHGAPDAARPGEHRPPATRARGAGRRRLRPGGGDPRHHAGSSDPDRRRRRARAGVLR